MHSTNPPTSDEADGQGDEDKARASQSVPPYCGAWWRWGPFLSFILFFSFALYSFADHADESFYVIEFILPPLLMLMFAQLFVIGKGLGWRAFVSALLRLFIALGFAAVCLALLMGLFFGHD